MKNTSLKGLLVIVVMLFTSLSVKGSEPQKRTDEPWQKFEFRLGWSGLPTMAVHACTCIGFPGPSLSELYGSYRGNEYTTGNITAEFVAVASKRVSLSIGLVFMDNFSRIRSSLDGRPVATSHDILFAIYPQIKGYWFRRDYLSMYSACGLGYGWYGSEFMLMPQVHPIGFEIGKGNIFGFGEMLNLGMQSIGGTIGIGYRF